jgi:hypothetical protein
MLKSFLLELKNYPRINIMSGIFGNHIVFAFVKIFNSLIVLLVRDKVI